MLLSSWGGKKAFSVPPMPKRRKPTLMYPFLYSPALVYKLCNKYLPVFRSIFCLLLWPVPLVLWYTESRTVVFRSFFWSVSEHLRKIKAWTESMYLHARLEVGPCKPLAVSEGGACVQLWVSHMLCGIRKCCLAELLVKVLKNCLIEPSNSRH